MFSLLFLFFCIFTMICMWIIRLTKKLTTPSILLNQRRVPCHSFPTTYLCGKCLWRKFQFPWKRIFSRKVFHPLKQEIRCPARSWSVKWATTSPRCTKISVHPLLFQGRPYQRTLLGEKKWLFERLLFSVIGGKGTAFWTATLSSD